MDYKEALKILSEKKSHNIYRELLSIAVGISFLSSLVYLNEINTVSIHYFNGLANFEIGIITISASWITGRLLATIGSILFSLIKFTFKEGKKLTFIQFWEFLRNGSIHSNFPKTVADLQSTTLGLEKMKFIHDHDFWEDKYHRAKLGNLFCELITGASMFYAFLLSYKFFFLTLVLIILSIVNGIEDYYLFDAQVRLRMLKEKHKDDVKS